MAEEEVSAFDINVFPSNGISWEVYAAGTKTLLAKGWAINTPVARAAGQAAACALARNPERE